MNRARSARSGTCATMSNSRSPVSMTRRRTACDRAPRSRQLARLRRGPRPSAVQHVFGLSGSRVICALHHRILFAFFNAIPSDYFTARGAQFHTLGHPLVTAKVAGIRLACLPNFLSCAGALRSGSDRNGLRNRVARSSTPTGMIGGCGCPYRDRAAKPVAFSCA